MVGGAGVGELLASAVVKEVAGKLSSFLGVVGAEIGQLWRLKEEVREMESTLATLQAVLSDAERRSLREEGVRLWLKRLKSAAHDVEDVLNDFQIVTAGDDQDGLLDKIRTFFSDANPIKSWSAIGHRLKKITKRLHEIAVEHNKYSFKKSISYDNQKEIKMRETFADIDVNDNATIVGRVDEKENIVGLLLETNCKEDISIIPIVGFGGLGKTTLAQLVFNDERVVFDLKIWVYVSMEFDLLMIGKAIVSQVERNQTLDNLQAVRSCLRTLFYGKRYLIVLDDLWNEDGLQLEQLKMMLKGGKRGSKVVVTTRSEKVASLMASTNSIQYLKVLSDQECWTLFSQRAFQISGEEANPVMVKIGKEIVNKCKGVPLAAKALGFIMRFKEGVDEWSAVRDNDIWELDDTGGSSSEYNVLSSLKLSYYNMPSYLKLCFAYCSVFPKGCDIQKDWLIQQWISLGFIPSTSRSLAPEKCGEEYVKALKGMSFLQDSGKSVTALKVLQMHDLVHDLARSIAGDEVLILDGQKETNVNFGGHGSRYALLMNYTSLSRISSTLPSKLRALHFRNCMSLQLPKQAFSSNKYLSVLDIGGCSVQELPASIGQLRQLRYLDASGMHNENLPNYIRHLKNLQALNFSNSSLERLPHYIGRFRKLRYLNLHGYSNLLMLPKSMGQLGDLFHLDLSGCSSCQLLPSSFLYLHNLSFSSLRGDLKSLSNCTNLELLDLLANHVRLPESYGNLCKLRFMDLSLCRKLRKLGESFGHFANIEYLSLSGCVELAELPSSFGNLQALQYLDLSWCTRLRVLPESFGSLRKLGTLDLSHCKNLQVIPNELDKLTCLKHLYLIGNPALSHLASCVRNRPNLNIYISINKTLKFVVHAMEEQDCTSSNIVELQHLNGPCHELIIECLENVKDPMEAETADLGGKQHVESLALHWTLSPERSEGNATKDMAVLGSRYAIWPTATISLDLKDYRICKNCL